MRLAVLVLGLVSLLPARAATVEVLVRERQAGPLENQWVILQPIATPGEAPYSDFKRMRSGFTRLDGKAVFEAVAIGRYQVNVQTMGISGLIEPSSNPLAPPPQITIAAERDKVSVEIELWRGSLLSSQVITDRAGIPKRAKVILRSLDGQPDLNLALDAFGRVDKLLLPGRYEMELVAPPGYLLVEVVWNGESLPGHVVRFDVREDTRRQSVSWYLSTPSLITGSIADATGACPARVVATLVQPGPWIQAATQRGGSEFAVVPHQEWDEHRPCVYRLWLPDGRWTVQPQGDALLSSEPESADVTIAAGETRILDFQLATKGADDPATEGLPLTVAVRSPEGRPVAGATVEIWPPDGNNVSAEPVQTGTTERYSGIARFRGLHAGDYLVAAGREDFLDATAKVKGYDPKGREPTYVTVTLREGARLHTHAVDNKDGSIQGVELSYTRLSPLPKMEIANEALVTKKRAGSALTDVTGHAEIPGLYSGDYRLEARMTGEQSATRFVLLRQGQQKHSRSIEVHLTEGERSDVDLLVLPAASLSGGLACSDRGTISPKVAFQLLPADLPVGMLRRDVDLNAGSAIAPVDVVLHGLDTFQLGPLSPGEYRLAVRPVGQHYWSWASDELVPDRAALFPVTETAATDAGVVEIECGPLVTVVPRLKSNEPVPDLRVGIVHASLRPAGDEKKGARYVSADVEVHADRAFVRRLPEGKFKTTLTVEHPYMIPPTISVPEQVLELTRGNVAEILMAFDRLGGMVEVHGDGMAARLTPGEGDPVIHPAANGKVNFPGTLPGTYRVELCGNADCSAVTATWKDVVVVAGRTRFLP